DRDLSGNTPGGSPVSLHVHVDFAQTGGNFDNGTGTATVLFTLQNTSPVIPFQAPAVGNPVLTQFFFDLPATASVVYPGARVLSGGTEFDSGNIGSPSPASCNPLAADDVRTSWYQLQGNSSSGQFGTFTNALSTANGINQGIVNNQVIP